MEIDKGTALAGAIVAVGSYIFGKKTGYNEGYSIGYKDGRRAGKRDAYELCLELGLVDDDDDDGSIGSRLRRKLK